MERGSLEGNNQMKCKIMVIDDDRALRTTLEEILMDAQWGVISAEDGMQARFR